MDKNPGKYSQQVWEHFIVGLLQRQNGFQVQGVSKYFHWPQTPVMNFRQSKYTWWGFWGDTEMENPHFPAAIHSRNPHPLAVLLTECSTKYHFWFPPFLIQLHKQGKSRPSFPEESLHAFPRHTVPWTSQLLIECYPGHPNIIIC